MKIAIESGSSVKPFEALHSYLLILLIPSCESLSKVLIDSIKLSSKFILIGFLELIGKISITEPLIANSPLDETTWTAS